MLGLDGATWDLLMPWIEQEKLPNIKNLIKNGSYGILKSTIPPITGPAWTSLATGKTPGKHGIFDFITTEGRIVNSMDIKEKRIWNILSNNNLSCCMINFPITYPPEKINGIMISSFLSPPDKKDFVFPKEVMKILEKNRYKRGFEFEKLPKIFVGDKVKKQSIRFEVLKISYEITETRFKTTIDLIKERDWNFLMVLFKQTDVLCHLFWDRKEILLEFFKKIDTYVGKIVEEFNNKKDECTIFIVSDHGFGNSPNKCFNLYPLMRKWSFTRPSLIWFLMSYFVDIPGINKIISKISKIWIFRRMFLKRHKQSGVKLWGMKFKKNGNINRLINRLKNAKDPETNERVFRKVCKREEVYKGKNIHKAPEIIFLPKPKYKAVYLPSNKIVTEGFSIMPGDHTLFPNGIFIISNKNSKKNFKLNAKIIDIFPTILHIFNIPIPKDVDGRVLKKVFKEDSEIFKRKVKYKKIGEGEKDRIRSVIKNLKL